jgi:hypothetical protein
MLFETVLLMLMGFAAVFLIGVPFYKLIKAVIPPKRDPLAEARVRLEQAQLEAEAAKLNKQTERIYQDTYGEVLDEEEETTEKEMSK